MPQIRPFAALRYARRPGLEPSSVIAPPFDVLDARSKAALQARNPNNIVTVDLPHLPAKTVGPDEAYQRSIAAAKARGIPVVVDPKGADFTRYRGATLVKPNLSEFEAIDRNERKRRRR